jgi:hypothetical protein
MGERDRVVSCDRGPPLVLAQANRRVGRRRGERGGAKDQRKNISEGAGHGRVIGAVP